jgi:hypothetical protein
VAGRRRSRTSCREDSSKGKWHQHGAGEGAEVGRRVVQLGLLLRTVVCRQLKGLQSEGEGGCVQQELTFMHRHSLQTHLLFRGVHTAGRRAANSRQADQRVARARRV